LGLDDGGWSEGEIMQRLFSRENMFALGLCLILILLVIVTSESSPQWIYQGF
jgi:hypothetical protein